MPTALSLPIIEPPQLRTSRTPSGTMDAWDDPADWHVVFDLDRPHLYVADGSRVYSIDSQTAQSLIGPSPAVEDRLETQQQSEQFLASLGIPTFRFVSDVPPCGVPLRSLSLAVAQKCNLGCSYCYAEGGSFGDTAKNMSLDVALKAVRRLLEDAQAGERVHLAFLGGEPLVNRDVLRQATEFARREAAMKKVDIGFSITTNGTLITAADAEFFEHHGFAVTISLDGVGQVHDRQRAFKSGRGSYEQIIERVTPLLQQQRRAQVSARVTVTPKNLCLPETLDQLIRLGFHSVGFSPMLSSPAGRDEMGGNELDVMLDQMIDCGRVFERCIIEGRRYGFSNMVNAMREIHRGTHRPYPCGAGAGYFGVSADGELFACHRFVGDESGAMGTLDEGIDADRQRHWLAERHVHFQQPCQSCWARYLCGGGCHHEVIHRGRPACNYIRGWLHYCLQAYIRLLDRRPDYFGMTDPPSARPTSDFA